MVVDHGLKVVLKLAVRSLKSKLDPLLQSGVIHGYLVRHFSHLLLQRRVGGIVFLTNQLGPILRILVDFGDLVVDKIQGCLHVVELGLVVATGIHFGHLIKVSLVLVLDVRDLVVNILFESRNDFFKP